MNGASRKSSADFANEVKENMCHEYFDYNNRIFPVQMAGYEISAGFKTKTGLFKVYAQKINEYKSSNLKNISQIKDNHPIGSDVIRRFW